MDVLLASAVCRRDRRMVIVLKLIKSVSRWFLIVVLVAFVAGNISGVLILCSVIDIMAGK